MNKIIVPTDFGVFSKQAIHYAATLAKGYGAELLLFHAYHLEDKNIFDTDCINGEHIPGYTKWEGGIQLDELKEMLAQRFPELKVRSVLKNGFVYEELLALVKSEQADFIVMHTNGAKGLERLIGGSTTSDVIAALECPVLVVPPGYMYQKPNEIIYASDLIQTHTEQLDFVTQLARFFDAHLSVLHILEEQSIPMPVRQLQVFDGLEPVKTFSNTSFHLLDSTSVVHGIRDFANFRKADLLVMVSHKRNFIQKIFQPSKTCEMSMLTNIPLLAMHTSDCSPA
ncbi:MAG: universal stress protein [Cytophagaceae bacterium]|jgi:nucleotide-binding universal stress UspA family protein|nr:universal stress protein [Cytophagaceae bacterium]